LKVATDYDGTIPSPPQSAIRTVAIGNFDHSVRLSPLVPEPVGNTPSRRESATPQDGTTGSISRSRVTFSNADVVERLEAEEKENKVLRLKTNICRGC
jgi:hypothetical protein